MSAPARPEPIRFTRGRRMYQIARSYDAEEGFIGIIDGKIVAKAAEAAVVARALIASR